MTVWLTHSSTIQKEALVHLAHGKAWYAVMFAISMPIQDGLTCAMWLCQVATFSQMPSDPSHPVGPLQL